MCGSLGRKPKIVGGKEVGANMFPWQVGLFRSGKLYCGASIITNRFLLTAGHCVSSFEPSDIRVSIILLIITIKLSRKNFKKLRTRLLNLVTSLFGKVTYLNNFKIQKTRLSKNFNKQAWNNLPEKLQFQAWVGSHNITKKDFTEIKRVKRIITHEEFDIFNFNNDIALLELDTPIAFGAKSTPICLPNGGELSFLPFTRKLKNF